MELLYSLYPSTDGLEYWPVGVVMEAKPQLVGIHERVRNDIDAPPSTVSGEKRISTASNPNAEESADLLRYE